MNRAEFQKLADLRAREAGVLLAARCYDGAYYLAGYAVECALKACIARKTRRYDFPPPRNQVDSYYIHDLGRLMRASGLEEDFERAQAAAQVLSDNWAVVEKWSEQSRYARVPKNRALALYKAVTDAHHGLLTWLKTHW